MCASFFNAFATEEYQLRKPRRRILPKLPDMGNFATSDPALKELECFAAEMFKWVPRLECLYYKGEYEPVTEEQKANAHTFTHNGEETTVTKEWWDEFNRYSVTETGDALTAVFNCLDGAGDYGSRRPETNAEGIAAYEAEHPGSDGFTDWRKSFIFGMRHRTPDFGPGSEAVGGWAGKDFGAAYANLDFTPAVWEWNNIKVPKSDEKDYFGDVETRARFIPDYLRGGSKCVIDITWDELNAWAKTKFGDMNFYDIVMTTQDPTAPASKKLSSAEDKIKFSLLGLESRSRLRSMENLIFGDIRNSQNDAAMKGAVDQFVLSHNPNLNFHAINFFLNVFRTQHSVTNFMTGFWDGNGSRGWNYSLLDAYRFNKFNVDMGTGGFRQYLNDHRNYALEANVGSEGDGALYSWRGSFSGLTSESAYSDSDNDTKKTKFNNVTELIKEWFGAYYPEWKMPVASDSYDYGIIDGKYTPIFGGHSDPPDDNAEGDWVEIPAEFRPSSGARYLFVPTYKWMSLGYDRKFNEEDLYVTSSDVSGASTPGDVSSKTTITSNDDTDDWGKLINWYYGSHINERLDDDTHPNFAAQQLKNVSNEWATFGSDFFNNWVVHLMGMLWKNGGGKRSEKITWRGMESRKVNRIYKEDVQATDDKRAEIWVNKMLEQRSLNKRMADRQKLKQADEARRRQMNQQLQLAGTRTHERLNQERAANSKLEKDITETRRQERKIFGRKKK